MKLINKKINHWKFPSTKNIKHDYNEFVPKDFRDKLLDIDSSYESEDNPLLQMEKEEITEFYNMVR